MFKCGPTEDGETTSYGYDAASQLTSEIRPGYNAGDTFDGNGKRLSKTVNGNTEFYSYDDGDKLLSAGVKTYTYDLAGRTTSVKVGMGAPSTLTYDDEDRLKTFMGQTYTYNGFDTRVGKNGTTYHRDGTGVTAPLISDSNATYTPGISERRNGVSTYLNSGLKDVAKQTDAAGVVTATRKYDAYGMVIGATGTWKGPFGYSGSAGYQEDETGLQLLGHRYYDSSTGRFITRDPIKDGRNWYVYCDNNPVNAIDAEGLKKKLIVMLGGTKGLPLTGTLADIYDLYGDEYDIVIKRVSTNQEVEDLMVEADAVVLSGHGSPFVLANNGGRLKNETLLRAAKRRAKKGKGLLNFLRVLSCTALAEEEDRRAYLALTKALFGYVDNCPYAYRQGNLGNGSEASKGRPGKWYYNPTVKIGGGGVRPSGGYTNVRLP